MTKEEIEEYTAKLILDNQYKIDPIQINNYIQNQLGHQTQLVEMKRTLEERLESLEFSVKYLMNVQQSNNRDFEDIKTTLKKLGIQDSHLIYEFTKLDTKVNKLSFRTLLKRIFE